MSEYEWQESNKYLMQTRKQEPTSQLKNFPGVTFDKQGDFFEKINRIEKTGTSKQTLWRGLPAANSKILFAFKISDMKIDKNRRAYEIFWTEKDISANANWIFPNKVSASSILKNINQTASNVEISSELQAKMMLNQHYKEFVGCINNTCKSYKVEKSRFAKYLLHEKRDIENPKWEKIILGARLYEKDFEKKLDFLEQLRIIIDKSLDELKNNTKNLDKVIELEKRFYINLCQ